MVVNLSQLSYSQRRSLSISRTVRDDLVYIARKIQRECGFECKIIIVPKTEAIKSLDLKQLEDVVLSHWVGATQPSLKSKSRKNEIVYLKQAFCLLAYLYVVPVKTRIAEYLGVDHTTVLYSIAKAEDRMATEQAFRNLFYRIKDELLLNNENGLDESLQAEFDTESALSPSLP